MVVPECLQGSWTLSFYIRLQRKELGSEDRVGFRFIMGLNTIGEDVFIDVSG
jgi:hypothetical protein